MVLKVPCALPAATLLQEIIVRHGNPCVRVPPVYIHIHGFAALCQTPSGAHQILPTAQWRIEDVLGSMSVWDFQYSNREELAGTYHRFTRMNAERMCGLNMLYAI